MRSSKVYIALLHHPIYNKRMDIVTTSITNLDLHDIARAARTYDADGFFVVHPAASQQKLVNDILAYWQEGYGGQYNRDRQEAFRRLKLVSELRSAVDFIEGETGQKAYTIATDARTYPNSISYRTLRQEIQTQKGSYLLLFGTGWGMTGEVMASCDYILAPVSGAGDYNHLAVRSAVSIILDRLLGESWFAD